MAKENEKIKKCSGLRVELSKRWNSECDVIPVVVGGLGCVSKNFEVYLKRIPAELSKELCTRITTWERKTNEIFPIKKMTMMHRIQIFKPLAFVWTGVAITAQIVCSKLAFVGLHWKWTT